MSSPLDHAGPEAIDTSSKEGAAGETASLEALRKQINDPTSTTLKLARALQHHLNVYPQNSADLGQKLGKSRSWVIQLVGFLRLPEDILAKAEEDGAGFRELQVLQASIRSANNANSEAYSANNETNSANTEDLTANNVAVSANNQTNSVNTPANRSNLGYPLLRDTVNALARVVFFWVRDPELGLVTERWAIRIGQTGWLRMGFLIAIYGLAVYGGWQLISNVERGMRSAEGGIPSLSYLLPHSAFRTPNSTFPAPRLRGSRFIAGHRMELRWDPQAPETTYRVYWNSPDGRIVEPVAGDVATPGAIVNNTYMETRKHGFLSVTAISPNQEESPASPLVAFDLTPVNDQTSVEPLPMKGTAVPKLAEYGASPPAPLPSATESLADARRRSSGGRGEGGPPKAVGEALHAPVEVHADVRTPDLIRLTWRAVGREVRYNVYSSASRELTHLRKENDHPLKSNTVDWTPETGLERYWIVVTTLEGQDHESAYSEAIEVVRHPEKSGSSETLDEAAGTLRKILPW